MQHSMIKRIFRNKTSSLINITGLSISMVVFMFLGIYIQHELSFDQYHEQKEYIYRLTTDIHMPGGNSHLAIANPLFGEQLKTQCPEINKTAYIEVEDRVKIKAGEKTLENVLARSASASLFKTFTFNVLHGDPSNPFPTSNSVVITRHISEQLPGTSSSIGSSIHVGDNEYIVSGVIEDIPKNSDLQFDIVTPFDLGKTESLMDFGDSYVFFLANVKDKNLIEEKINQITKNEYQPMLTGEFADVKINHVIQPLSTLHFESALLADTPKGNRTMLYMLSAIAFAILIIAGINYTNLSLTNQMQRFKEFQIMRTLGAGKTHIFFQGIGESFFIALVSVVIATALFFTISSDVNSLFRIDIGWSHLFRYGVPVLLLALIYDTAMGIFPASKALKQLPGNKHPFSRLSKGLILFQFSAATLLLIILFTGNAQVNFMKTTDLGFNSNQIIAINTAHGQTINPHVLKEELVTLPGIHSAAFGGDGTELGSTGLWMKSIRSAKNEDDQDVQFILNIPEIGENYIELFGMELVQGRNFSLSHPADKHQSVIINETFAKTMGWKEPLGKQIDENGPLRVIGVVKDFNFTSLHNPIEPLMFRFTTDRPAYLFLRASPSMLNQIESTWKKLYKDLPLKYTFVDEHFNAQYEKDQQQLAVFKVITLVTLCISCLGLFGMARYFSQHRTKEIGIRKVNGAKALEVLTLLDKDFAKLVFWALVIAFPMGWIAANKWLQNFAYQTDINLLVFVFAGFITLFIALITVSWQSWRAASRNPVEALRYE